MLVKDLPSMVRHLKDRGVYVLFNTNGTVLNARNGRALIDAGSTSCASRSTPRTRRPTGPSAARTTSSAS
jgi:hypothetical protein